MKLLFDLTPAQWVANGSGIYASMVFDSAIKRGFSFDCIYSADIVLPERIQLAAIKNNCRLFSYKSKSDIEKIIVKNNYDKVYFSSSTNSDCYIPEEVEMIVTVHDLRFIEVPTDKFRHLYRTTFFERFKQRIAYFLFPDIGSKLINKLVSSFIDRSKLKIVTVSNHSKYSIIQFFPNIQPNNVAVLYCPYPESKSVERYPDNSEILFQNQLVSNEYILIISANRWFKNSYRALLACDELISNSQFHNKKVVVVGKPGPAIISKIKNKSEFIFIDYVEDEQLQILYRNAFCFIYPSLQEGFGIPPLEAMAAGTPVLASAVASITEICGDSVLYFNPYFISEIKNRVLNVLNDENLRIHLIQKSEMHINRLHEQQQKDLNTLIDLIFK